MIFFYCGLIYVASIIFISSFLMAISIFISKKMRLNREKLSSFECGFDPMMSPRNTFSLRFFLLAVVFLIFDVELALIIPYICSLTYVLDSSCVFYMLIFMIILFLGLVHELNEGSLEWSN